MAHEISLLDLSEGILILVSMYLDVPSFSSFLRVNRRLLTIESSHRDFLWENRLLTQYGRLLGLQSDTIEWKKIAKNLHHGVGNYHGFCLDQYTSNFSPYPMHLEIVDRQRQARGGHHSLRWRTLGDSMTRVVAEKERRQDGSGDLDYIVFSEVELLQGSDILVPNHYFGWYCGHSIIGVYPGGSFFALRREAISEDRLQKVFLHGVDENGSNEENQHSSTIHVGMKFVGAVTMELAHFAQLQMAMRRPRPVSAELELVIEDSHVMVEDGAPLTIFVGHIVVSNNSDSFRMSISMRMGGQRSVDAFLVASGEVLTMDGEPYQVNEEGNSIVEFMISSKLYGWFQGDSFVGLVKDRTETRTGSFFLQLRNSSRLFMLGMKNMLADFLGGTSNMDLTG